MLVLVDTSVWLEHFRRQLPAMTALLRDEDVVIHPLVIGEIAVGNLADRARTLRELGSLLEVAALSPVDVLASIESHTLFGRLSWSDVQLLATAEFHHISLWTLDKRLENPAQTLGLGWTPSSRRA